MLWLAGQLTTAQTGGLEIRFGEGVCGTAARDEATQVVADVHAWLAAGLGLFSVGPSLSHAVHGEHGRASLGATVRLAGGVGTFAGIGPGAGGTTQASATSHYCGGGGGGGGAGIGQPASGRGG